MVNGLFDYYLSTNSSRVVEVLAGIREPHDKHLFDKFVETLNSKTANNGQKVSTLTLLSLVARKQPTWLYNLAKHPLLKQLLHLLKVKNLLELGLKILTCNKLKILLVGRRRYCTTHEFVATINNSFTYVTNCNGISSQ